MIITSIWAAEKESMEVFTLLLRWGADVNFPNDLGRTPLHIAVLNKRVSKMQKLLEIGAEVNKADENKQTSLHYAAKIDCVEAADDLLKAMAAINKQDYRMQTPLFLASYHGSFTTLERLLQNDADVKLISEDGMSPLHAGADNLEVTKLLVAHGADINLRKKDLWSPLHLAIFWAESLTVKFLLENGANPNQANDNSDTGLHLALDKHSHEMVAALLSHGAEVERRGYNGRIPLHMVIDCTDYDADMVQLLLNNGADFKTKTKDGLSCLSLAAGRDVQTLKKLLNVGSPSASSPIWDLDDMIAAYWNAIESNFPDCVEVLVKNDNRLLSEVSK